MTPLSIDAETLKTVRKSRKIGRPKLAKMTGVSERLITKIETATVDLPEVAEQTASQLAYATQVPLETLTGKVQVSEDFLNATPKPSCSCCS